jgi:hypothetical protein
VPVGGRYILLSDVRILSREGGIIDSRALLALCRDNQSVLALAQSLAAFLPPEPRRARGSGPKKTPP